MFKVILILAIYLVCIGLVYRKKMNLLVGLPLMSILIAVVSGISLKSILTDVLSDGSLRLHNPMIVILFGATLAEIVKRSGMIEFLIRYTAEYLGDKTLLVSLALFLITAILFSVLGGLGAIVMVGSVVLPILLSVGVSKVNAASILLFGISIGGTFNLMNWTLFTEVLGLTQNDVLKYSLCFIPVALVVAAAFIIIELRRTSATSFRLNIPEKKQTRPPILSFFTPLVPVALVFAFGVKAQFANVPDKAFQFPILTAMLIGMVYGLVTLPKGLGPRGKILVQSVIDGTKNVAPALSLMIGIGILLKTVGHPVVKESLSPLMKSIMPSTAMHYLIFFICAAPLALYRGPLNIWGLGSGIVTLMKDTHVLPAAAIMAALVSVGQIQGVSDPTNTYNVWIANYIGTDVAKIMKRTLLYAWLIAIGGLCVAVFLYF